MKLTCCYRCRATDRRLYLPDHTGHLYCAQCLPVDGLTPIERSQVVILRSQEIRAACRELRRKGRED